MDHSLPHGLSLWNFCSRPKMLLSLFVAAALHLDIIHCASVVNSSRVHGSLNEVQNGSFSQNQSSDLFAVPSFAQSVHQNKAPAPSASQNAEKFMKNHEKAVPIWSLRQSKPAHSGSTERKAEEIKNVTKGKATENEGIEQLKFRKQPDNEQNQQLNKTVAQSEVGTPRACPGCSGSECDPILSTNTNISGIPVIEILAAIAVGGAWAGIIAWIVHNFKKQKKGEEEEGGYGYGDEYGATGGQEYEQSHTGYENTGYNTNRISNRYGRSSHRLSLNRLADWVIEAVDKVANLYET